MDQAYDVLIKNYGIFGIVMIAQWMIIGVLWKHNLQKAGESRTRENTLTEKIFGLIESNIKALEKINEKIGDIQLINQKLFDVIERIISGESDLKNSVDGLKQLLNRGVEK